MRYLTSLLLIVIFLSGCMNPAGDEKANRKKPANETEENILRCADNMMAAYKNKDWPTFAKYNNPGMIKLMGGQEAFEKLLVEQMKQTPDSIVKSLTAGNILQVVKTAGDMQCVLEQKMIAQMEAMQITSTTYLVGESLDGGKNWTFFDGAARGLIKPINIKPNLSPDLKIPEKKQEMKQM